MMAVDKLRSIFYSEFEDTGLENGAFFAPGRVNLIGEHTDYNDGFVLPMAINKSISMFGQLRGDRLVKVYSIDYDSRLEFDLDELSHDPENIWINYIMGVISEYQKKGNNINGLNIALTGDIPRASGLSSSAALQIVTAYTIAELNGLSISGKEMALLCQSAEKNFVGVNAGIMDQYISRLGQNGHALMIDCRSLEYELVPLSDEEYNFVICNSRVERGLVESSYNERRKECEQAASYFKHKLDHPVNALRDIDSGELHKFGSGLPDSVFCRARHVITENNRVLKAVQALKKDDFNLFGKLMVESHNSLKNDYQVSCEELDILVKLALNEDGVAGARMTGAGFGGCTVNLVRKESTGDFAENIRKEYKSSTGIIPEIYISGPADGAGKMEG